MTRRVYLVAAALLAAAGLTAGQPRPPVTAADLERGSVERRLGALVEILDIPAGQRPPAMWAAIRREADRMLDERRHVQLATEDESELHGMYAVGLVRALAELHDPTTIPLLIDSAGWAGYAGDALVEFGDVAVSALIATVRAQRGLEGRKVPRVDEAAHDPELARLRDRLLMAAKQRDLAQLLPLLSDPVRPFFDEMSRDEWAAWFEHQSASDQAPFWQDLRDAFTLGMAYEHEANEPMLLAPYTTVTIEAIVKPTDNDPDQYYAIKDPDQYYAITGSGVAVRRDPTMSSPIIERLDYDLVQSTPAGTKPTQAGVLDGVYEWLQVKTRSGELGWMTSKYAWNVFDIRFVIKKSDGVWKVTAWASGD